MLLYPLLKLELPGGTKMESKEYKLSMTKINIVAIILIFLFCTTLFLRHERVCALINPNLLKQYNEILGNKNKNFRAQKLGPGHMIFFQFKENKKSLGELYSLTDIKFVPDNKTLTIWKGKDKIKKWNDDTALIENMQRFRIRFKIPVPEDKNLEGQTIKGTLHLKLSYPALINYTMRTSTVHSET